MTEKNKQRIRVIYGICLGVWTVVTAVLFIVQVWALFRATDVDPYSVETVSKRFSQIAVPFWGWIALIVGGGVVSLALPEIEQKPRALVSVGKTLTRLKGRLPENAEGMVELNKKSVLRKAVWIACAAVCVAAGAVVLAYLLNKDYVGKFTTEFYKTHVEAEKLVKIFPWVFAALCVCAGALIYQSYSLRKELTLVKKMVADSARRGGKHAVQEEKNSCLQALEKRLACLRGERAKNITRIVLAVGSVALIIIGIANGGMRDVLLKAINICTQCIGLG